MHWTLLVTLCLLGWALASFPKRPPSLVIVLMWCVGQLYWYFTNDSLPRALYSVTDAYILVSLWLWRKNAYEPLEWAIAFLLIIQQIIYNWEFDDNTEWWLLWYTFSAQLLLAGPWFILIDLYKRHRNKKISHYKYYDVPGGSTSSGKI